MQLALLTNEQWAVFVVWAVHPGHKQVLLLRCKLGLLEPNQWIIKQYPREGLLSSLRVGDIVSGRQDGMGLLCIERRAVIAMTTYTSCNGMTSPPLSAICTTSYPQHENYVK